MDENINESAEIQEVAEPEDEALESAETQEVADPDNSEDSAQGTDSVKSEQDAAFAEMRRTNQALEKANKQMREALSRYFEGETDEELSINALAYAEQRDPEEYREEYERLAEFDRMQAENENLKEQLINAQVERMMRDDLTSVQAIDPDVKSLDELGAAFIKMRLDGGLSVQEAYYACKAMELKEKILAPDAIGKVSDTKAERDYYTSEEIDNLTDEELDDPDIWAKVMRSMDKLSKR